MRTSLATAAAGPAPAVAPRSPLRPLLAPAPRVCRARGLVITAAKRARGPRPDGGVPSKSGGGGGGGGGKAGGGGGKSGFKSPGNVREGGAYEQETRKIILALDRVTKTAPSGKKLLDGVGLGMYLGAKIGILGPNGAGKSTLMRILAGRDDAFDGRLQLTDGIKVSMLEQEPELDDGGTVDDNIRPALARVQGLLQEYEAVSAAMAAGDGDMDSLLSKMDRLQTQIDACNGWELERTLARATDALRCPPGDAAVATLSGGERRRVALARVLLEAPDILLLDEPTNHLDALSVAWLERTLADFRGTVVAITHDRYFLDNVAGWILELDRGKGIPFEGCYSEWLEAKAKRADNEGRTQASLQAQMEAELEWVRSNAKGQQKKGKARLRRYDDLVEEAASYVRAASVDTITIPTGPRLGGVVLEVDGAAKGFGERKLFEGLSFSVPPGACVGVVGGNGVGKSTLFKMVMGMEAPDAGTITLGETVKPMYVDQSRDSLNPDATVVDEISGGRDVIPIAGRDVNARQYCSWYGFKGSDSSKKVGVLSGGERNRLHLAKTLSQTGNLLLLDEPTNDLSIDTMRALENALYSWAGTSIIISHDRRFLDRLATHILAFEDDSSVVWFEGSYSEYEADWRKRTGGADPSRVKYRRMATAA